MPSDSTKYIVKIAMNFEAMAKDLGRAAETMKRFNVAFMKRFKIGREEFEGEWWRDSARRERMKMERQVMRADARSRRNSVKATKKRKHGR